QFFVDTTSNEFLLDSLTAINSSIEVKDLSGKALPFEFNSTSGFIKIDNEGAGTDSVEVCFQTFPYSLHRVYANRDLGADYDSTALFKIRKAATEIFDFKEEIFSQSNLN